MNQLRYSIAPAFSGGFVVKDHQPGRLCRITSEWTGDAPLSIVRKAVREYQEERGCCLGDLMFAISTRSEKLLWLRRSRAVVQRRWRYQAECERIQDAQEQAREARLVREERNAWASGELGSVYGSEVGA